MPYFRVRPVAASEGAASLDFLITLDEASASEVRVSYQLVNGSAIANNSADFQAQSGTLVFAPGQTSKTVTAVLTNNTTIEATEVFWLDLFSPVNAVVSQRYWPALVFDNDGSTGTPAIAVNDIVVDEAAGSASFFVSLSRPAAGPVSVSYATADDTAVAGQDYLATAGLLNFAAGERVKTVTVGIVNDSLAETAETFRLVLANPSGATLAEGFGVAEIGSNDAPPTGTPRILARGFAAGEGDAYANWVVQLDAPSLNAVTVSYQFLNGSAIANNAADFQAQSGTLVFAPGETTKTLTALITDNTTAEGTEAFWLDLFSPVNAVVPQRYTPAFIFDDDGTTGTPAIAVSDPVVDESGQFATFMVALDRPSAGAVAVAYATADDTAMAGQDYRAASGVLNFAAGEMVKTVQVEIFDDSLAESSEFFRLVLGNAVQATLAEPFGVAEIARNDAPPTGTPQILARALAVGEGDAHATFVVQLSAPSLSSVTVSYQLDNGTAIANNAADFHAKSETLVFAPGETSKAVTVLITDNTAAEGTEAFWLDLFSPVNGVVPQRYTPAYIVDNDGTTGTPGIRVGDTVVDESAGLASLFVWLDRPSASPVSIAYATADDTAVAGQDFRAASGTLHFAPGEMVKTVQVDIFDDVLTENAESFGLVLGNPVGASIVDGNGAALIGASDQPSVGQPQVSARPIVVSEGDAMTGFVLQLSAPSRSSVTVNYQLVNGTAIANNAADFHAKSETLVFAPGETVKWIPLLLTDNTAAEGDEVFSLDLFSATNATIAQRLVAATIVDDDGSARVFSYGRSNDQYTVTSALDRIVESANGGIDTVRSSVSYTLPDHVENLVLTGAAGNGVGNAAQNVFRGTAANNTFDGRDGIDTVIFSGPRADYLLAGDTVARTVSGGADGSDTLLSVERLQFADTVLANDTLPGGHTYQAWAMFNAGFDRAPSPAELSQWTAQLDRLGGNQLELAQAMINHYAPGVPDDELVAHLWSTIVGTPIPLDMLVAYTGLLADGSFTQASLVEFVANIDLNTVELVGVVGQTVALDPAWFPLPGA
ncbi:MAG: Calx-beta domain-containing protein [Rubrivivax sp.]|nr:Calx-beta domain-containing protein [Rubrivivax sp.]